MSKIDILAYLIENNITISNAQILICILVSLVMGMGVYIIYRISYTGTAYSKSFAQSLVLMAVVTTIIMTTIQSNLALSLGMVGSLSIIRFRTAIKDARDLAFVFWVVSIGVACGAAIFVPAGIGSVVFAIVVLIFSRSIYEQTIYLLVVEMEKNNADNENKIAEIIKKFSKKYKNQMCNISDEKEEYIYQIQIKSDKTFDIVNELKSLKGLRKVHIVTYNGEMIG